MHTGQQETAPLPRRSWCTSRGSAYFDWRWRERPVLALRVWGHLLAIGG